MKTCTKCGVIKTKVDFPSEKKRRGGLYPWCRLCLSTHRKERYIKRPRHFIILNKVCSKCKKDLPRTQFRAYPSKTLHGRCITCEDRDQRFQETGVWECTACLKVKPLVSFYKCRQTKTSAQCIACHKNYNEDTRDRRRWLRIANTYGLTREQYEEQLEKQGLACAVCKRTVEELGRPLVVEHSHETHEWRGLTCNYCNILIGSETNPDMFFRIAAYLKGPFTGHLCPEKKRKKRGKRRTSTRIGGRP